MSNKQKAESCSLSVCMIVKNEKAILENCLRQVVRFADELIIVDTGSTDGTKDIAHRRLPDVGGRRSYDR